jgi:hypothetical protein
MPDETKAANPSASAEQFNVKPVKFIHRRGDLVPTYFADGGWGTLNYYSLIRVSLFTENPQMATAAIQPVNPDGSAKGEQIHEGVNDDKYYIINRDFQCNITLTVPAAIQVYQMLGNFIKLAQVQMKDQSIAMQNQMREAAEKKAAQQTK